MMKSSSAVDAASRQADIITDDMSLLERFVLPVKRVLTESL